MSVSRIWRLVLAGWLVLMLAACSPARLYALWGTAEARLHGFEPAELALPDGRLASREGGSGPAVLLIHGFGANGLASWKAPMLDLVRDHRVLVPDLLWFGDSVSDRTPSLDAQADALQALLADRGIRQVELVGISYGGFVAVELARRLPQAVSRLVIVNSPGPVYTQDDLQALLKRADATSPAALFVPQDAAGMRRLWRMVSSKTDDVPNWVLEEVRETYLAGREPALYRLMDDLLVNMDGYLPRYTGMSWPDTRLVWSEGDRVFPLAIGERLAQRLGAPLIRVPAAGHNLPVDRPEQAVTALRKALGDNLQGS